MKILTPRVLVLWSSRPVCFLSTPIIYNSTIKDEIGRGNGEHHSFSTSASYLSTPPWRSNYDEESRNVKISVWWDFENCTIPSGVNVFKIANRITYALRFNGIKGPVSITAFGDILQLSRAKQEALMYTGISLKHVPNSGKNSADRSLLVDLMYWTIQNPPPAHIFLISGDTDFAEILHRLRMNNYNILLATANCTSDVLCSSATIMWHWNVLVKGESFVAKHFNHPPDGSHSWYGHYKGPLDDPFQDMLQHSDASKHELNPETVVELKVHPIPKVLINHIKQILNSNPQGISLVDLRSELAKSHVTIDKDYFGYKKFSRFLLAMPNIAKLQPSILGDGQQLVFPSHSKPIEPIEVASKPSTGEQTVSPCKEQSWTSKLDKSSQPSSRPTTEASPIILSCKHPSLPISGTTDQCSIPIDSSCKNSDKSVINSSSISQHSDKVSSTSTSSGENTEVQVEQDHDTFSSRQGFFGRFVKWLSFWSRKVPNPVDPNSDLVEDNKFVGGEEECKRGQMKTRDLFNDSVFWHEIETFLNTPTGVALVTQSQTRKQMGDEMQRIGPSSLSNLTQKDLLSLVNILITEKKWVGESFPSKFPFSPTHSSKTSAPVVIPPSASNGLSSIFSRGVPNSNMQKLTQYELERQDSNSKLPQNIAELRTWIDKISSVSGKIEVDDIKQQFKTEFNREFNFISYGFSSFEELLKACSDQKVTPSKGNKPPQMSAKEILSDCQKFLLEVLEENPEGLNLGSFKPMFQERYGYILDPQKLGYTKISSLLQALPGVQVESNTIFKEYSHKDNKNRAEKSVLIQNKSDDSGEKESDKVIILDHDSEWEELGPVSEKTNAATGSGVKGRNKLEPVEFGEQFLDLSSDEDVSDLDNDKPDTKKTKVPQFRGRDAKESSLLQILDSWYGSKEEQNQKDREMSYFLRNNDDRSSEAPKTASGNSFRATSSIVSKTKSRKSYSFVTDSVEADDKEKLVNNILGSLKKSTEPRLPS